ncbi:hypothetical protein [Kribbella monticola]|uniref:hypothetical protein n=1 Tax=Kribbella monticola TaxID=2185285 RepID=UPI000DD4C90D|nr:hypothetical protein [Kribbella monticola]
MSAYLPNDGRFPDDSAVWTPYPLPDDKTNGTPDENWPWLRGYVLGQCGPDEWHIAIDVPELIEHGDGYDWLPACFRESCELRPLVTGD